MPSCPHLLSFHLSSHLIVFYISHINSSTQHPQALFQNLHTISSFIINGCLFPFKKLIHNSSSQICSFKHLKQLTFLISLLHQTYNTNLTDLLLIALHVVSL
ncbi:hypothetical protein CROQUDRAFT_602129 [Cronartium quercuum f. sp. fusiforme G11]|uniref:Uncharacterized protein n=1 Tax=Cronartium quercuum f. sp. fusiforme G11 TaxID=708437 RepID=A0A9P6NPU2_9BASI|nr:hypothetical protein CROQUDRAFT_602129 [Cronartium quercuum f. sp. fusiforme G11]